jgi:hypothetical protein
LQRRQQEEIDKDWRRRVDVPNLLTSALRPPPDKPLEDYCALGDMTAVPVTTVPVPVTTVPVTTVPITTVPITTVPVTTVTADVTDKVLPARVPLDSTKLGPSDDAVGSDTVGKVLAVTPATHKQTE